MLQSHEIPMKKYTVDKTLAQQNGGSYDTV